MNPNNEYQTRYASYLSLIEPALRLAVEPLESPLKEAISYSLLSGGKRLRPVLTLACCDLLHGCMEDAIPFACAVEMIHAYSLIHDDLPCMDDDDLRRGQPTNHKVFGEAMAVLAGDGLQSLAFATMAHQTLEATNVWHACRAMAAVADGCGVQGMVNGQVRDLQAEGKPVSLSSLQAIHAQKTGALIEAACLAGAACAGADTASYQTIGRFGQAVGLAFQIADDILDATSDAQTLGKTPGKDARDHKATYVSLLGLETARLRAQAACQQAEEALSGFGESAWFLRMTAQNEVKRSK